MSAGPEEIPELPPFLAQMFAQQHDHGTDPAHRAACESFQRASVEQQLAERKTLIRWAWLFCTCSRRFDREVQFPQAGCVLHSGLLWDPLRERWMI